MKKLLSILILLVLFISCKELPEREINGKCRSKVEIINNDIGSDIKVQTLTYKGHDYIIFKSYDYTMSAAGYMECATMGVEHDPDCKTCKNK